MSPILIPLLASLAAAPDLSAPSGSEPPAARDTVTYRVRQTTRLDQIAPDSKQVKWWISIPSDERNQDVLDFTVVSAPGPWRIERELEHGNRFLYVEVADPKSEALETVVEFTLRRDPVWVDVDPEKVGPITETHRGMFREEVSLNSPHMEVTEEIQAIADRECEGETNVALQARKLLDFVADQTDHYSKDPSKPSCGIGDAGDCLTNLGGCCTDMHSLFIALARARGIPARLQMGYRLLEKNAGLEVDPGYRCWAEYFAPGYGWVPADVVEADATGGLGRAQWFSGLTERRLWLNEGRNFVLAGAKERVNHMSLGYAEIDQVPARVLKDGELEGQLSRKVHFEELGSCSAAAPAAQ